jgi:hypothetical protein
MLQHASLRIMLPVPPPLRLLLRLLLCNLQ